MKITFKLLFLSVMLLATSLSSNAQNMHEAWNSIVSKYVVTVNNGHSTEVDYAAIKRAHSELRAYLTSLTAVSQSTFDSWEKPKQLAFLINAYNAWTVELIVSNLATDNHPNLKSIKDLGGFFSSPWSKDFITLLGKTRSLDDIEHKLIRGSDRYNDPRIHFAVNCASIGCPALREEAYMGTLLEAQLHAQTLRFLADESRNIAHDNTLRVSSIFKWYGDDFEKGFRGAKSLQQFFLQYPEALKLTPFQQERLKNDNMKIQFLDYNWNLNNHQ